MNDVITHIPVNTGADQDRQARIDLAAVYRLLAATVGATLSSTTRRCVCRPIRGTFSSSATSC